MKTVILLAMHGTPPTDFPRDLMAEFFGGSHNHSHSSEGHDSHDAHDAYDSPEGNEGHTHNGHDHAAAPTLTLDPAEREQQLRLLRKQRRAEIGAKMRAWPRTAANDPFFAGSQELADHLSQASGCQVVVGFNEFCDPT